MAKRYTPLLECLEARQALAVSPSLPGMAAAAPNPGPAVTVPQVAWVAFVFGNVPGAPAPASSAGPAPGDAPQAPAAPSAGNAVAAASIPIAGSSSPPATANQGGLSKEGPVAQ